MLFFNKKGGANEPKQRTAKGPSSWLSLPAIVVLLVCTLLPALTAILAVAIGEGTNEAPGGLAVLHMDMGDFATFNWTKITLTGKPTTKLLLRSLPERDLFQQAKGQLESGLDAATKDAGKVVGGAQDKVKNATQQISDKAKGLVDEVGNNLGDVKALVERLVEKVLGKIEQQLNEWGLDVVRRLNELGMSQRYSLHVRYWCKVPRVVDYTNSTTKFSTGIQNCTSLFGEGVNTTFDPAINRGRIFRFSPGDLVTNVTQIFLMPKDVQQKIREPIDKGANAAQREIDGALASLKRGAMLVTFGPTLVVYAVACTCSWLLFVAMAVDLIYYFVKGRRNLAPEQRYLTTKAGRGGRWTLAAALQITSTVGLYAFLLASVIVTVVGLMTSIVNKLSQAVHVQIAAGASLIWLSWVSFALLWLVRFGLKHRAKKIEIEHEVQARMQDERMNAVPMPGGAGAPRAGPYGDSQGVEYDDSVYPEKHNDPRY
ncbi:hypothetical protein PG985_014841 [Apiospora marii]|uniref:Uncharacterized protein n=1 Tax=Apiospora marii TaxID=335849 RepID=A0ABR1RKC5_9PEZI